MVMNKEAYECLFPTINMNDILIDTWFLSKDNIGHFKCNKLTIELIYKIIYSLKNNYKITELSTVSGNEYIQQYRLIYDDTNNDTLDIEKIKEVNNKLNTINLNIQFPLKVFNDNGVVVDCFFNNSTELQFSLIDNIIDISLDYSSIFVQDNRLYLALIYLYNIGFIKIGTFSEICDIRLLLKDNKDINYIISKLEAKGGITILDNLYQYIENCVMVIKNKKAMSLKSNQLLSSINKMNLYNFLYTIGQIADTEFKYRNRDLI